MADIKVFIEVNGGEFHDVSLQALAAARQAAAGGKVSCLVAGHGVKDAVARLFALGADAVEVAEDARLAAYTTRPFRKIVAGWLSASPAPLAVFGATTVGNNLAPAVAGALGWACAVDCDAVTLENGAARARRAGFDRKVMTQFAPQGATPMVVTLRDGSAEIPVPDAARTAGAVGAAALPLDDADFVAKVLRRDVAAKTVNLKAAKVIVSAGAGVGSPEGLALVKQLASALGAEMGATRAVVDAGWLAADHQIGQTGATVRPALYIACGISGAVQHRVGMQDSAKIIAINTDPNAPIFRIAHYKIVGDVKTVVPKLVKVIQG